MDPETLAIMITFASVAWAGIFGGTGAYVARARRRSQAEGVVLGLILGPIGLLIESLMPMERGPDPGSTEVDDDLVALRVNRVDFGRVPRADAELVRRMAARGDFRDNAAVARFLDELEMRRPARPAR